MLDSLERLGYQVSANDASADVEIWFDQPRFWNFSKGPYKIGYHPWESTELLPGWADMMNECDEIWTPSPLIADWYTRYAGVKVPVHVYEHGIDEAWKPVMREHGDTVKFLHIGAEASRKGGWDTVRAFRRAFPDRKDVSLTIKMVNGNWNGIPQVGRVRYIDKKFSFPEMKFLYYTHDVFAYPSYGEGFGLTPMQALGTGMPVVGTQEWAPYRRFMNPDLNVSAKLATSPWPKVHPGKMLRPDFDEYIDRLRYAADNYETIRNDACSKAFDLHRAYNWDDLTSEAFKGLENRL